MVAGREGVARGPTGVGRHPSLLNLDGGGTQATANHIAAARKIAQLFVPRFCETRRMAETEAQFRERQNMYSTAAARKNMKPAKEETEEEWQQRKNDAPSV